MELKFGYTTFDFLLKYKAIMINGRAELDDSYISSDDVQQDRLDQTQKWFWKKDQDISLYFSEKKLGDKDAQKEMLRLNAFTAAAIIQVATSKTISIKYSTFPVSSLENYSGWLGSAKVSS